MNRDIVNMVATEVSTYALMTMVLLSIALRG